MWEANSYIENSLLQVKWVKRFLFDAYQWTGKEDVLDIGCGDGRITAQIAQCVPKGKVIGIDSSLSMVTHAKEQYAKIGNLNFILANACHPDFYQQRRNGFDLIVSFHCLHWIENQIIVLHGIAQALKEDGKGFLRLVAKGWDPLHEIANNLSQSVKWHPYFKKYHDPLYRFSAKEYKLLIEEVGLSALCIEERVEDDLMPDLKSLKKYTKSWLPQLKELPSSLQESFLDELMAKYLANVPPEKDGSIHVFDSYLEIELIKNSKNPVPHSSLVQSLSNSSGGYNDQNGSDQNKCRLHKDENQ